ncbi:adenosylcobinamide-GDP ribazoletransferase [Hwanghaeella grinnelliae]|uniref:Adenosylcobinamide-GDP ribazoletransferase n=1 Tax=Hwanghaeella grinnelliae TaxID=2500179 RepID=A0A3S3UNH1_9PROT|nr:adenosylcobinamide-GDP ribazoletransferase [Hwanghaeella grinnelliae]RVU36111.1 adenosylcobinamide-GDP ribazoletransferase [Hwanghaeella grinnelliae]
MTDKPEEIRHSTGFAPIADMRAAMTFLTRFPVGGRHRALDACAWAFPIAGIAVGVTGGAVFWLAGWMGLPPWIAAFLTLTATALVTGALHEDGLADAADGLGAGGSVDRKLEIMRDSRIGGYGALALMLATGIKAAAIASFLPGLSGATAILAVHILSRAILPGVMAALPPASASGVAASVGRPRLGAALVALTLGAGSAIGLMGLCAGLVALAAVVASALVFGLLLRRSLGGYNGDTIGLLEQLSEIAIMLALLIAAASFNILVQTGAAFG